jgi:predicted metal-binding protein
MARQQRQNPTRRSARPSLRHLVNAALEAGALAAKVIDPSTVETAPWVRWKCQYGCDGFATSLVCPPHSPTPDQTRKMLDSYRRAVLFEAPLGKVKAIAVLLERTLFLEGHCKAFGLGAGPCELCPTCAFDKGCRHSEHARPAMEACGIDVFATVRKHGFVIEVVRSQSDPQHYFGLVLVD